MQMFQAHFNEYDLQRCQRRNTESCRIQIEYEPNEYGRRSLAKNVASICVLVLLNAVICCLLYFAYGIDNFIIIIGGLLNLLFVIFACIGIAVNIRYLLIANAASKTLLGMFLSFAMCQTLEGFIKKEGVFIERENVEFFVWIVFAILCTAIELRLMMFAWTNRLPSDDLEQPPPKYSICVAEKCSQNSDYLPTYKEALKMIKKQKKAESRGLLTNNDSTFIQSTDNHQTTTTRHNRLIMSI